MTILFEAWKRTHGGKTRYAETLGAPAHAGVGSRKHSALLLWLLCLLLAALAAGLGVYIWLAPGPVPVREANLPATQPPPSVTESGRTDMRAAPAEAQPEADAHEVHPAPVVVESSPIAEAPPMPAAESERLREAASAPGRAAAETSKPSRDERVSGAPLPAPIALAAVPDEIRGAFPPLHIAAHVWNADPDRRFIVIGGRQYRAGDTIAAGVRLLEITRRGEIVVFRGYRIRLP